LQLLQLWLIPLISSFLLLLVKLSLILPVSFTLLIIFYPLQLSLQQLLDQLSLQLDLVYYYFQLAISHFQQIQVSINLMELA